MKVHVLRGKRILIVEDEYFIAADLKRALGDRDAVVLGPVASLDAGMAVLDDGGAIDIAVLDVNLDGADSYPIAERLAARGVPFVFVTGYDGWAMPSAYRSIPRLAKPFPPGAVVRTIEQMIEEK
ncbi:MAG: response regulator [Sphingomonas adhaesiva]|uniref:response regulator n=1 Tax=Sphingomonas adhaesiva TaxID=28212 RepID=UPI002FFCB497